MTTPFKNPIKNFAPVFLILATLFLFGFGCKVSKPISDPLAGFHHADEADMDKNKAITGDYKAYVQTLSPEERKYLSTILFYEDGTGQHAVRITIGLNGTVWRHVLIYDRNDKRIKTIKYASGDYHS